jgi:hypothetical protein
MHALIASVPPGAADSHRCRSRSASKIGSSSSLAAVCTTRSRIVGCQAAARLCRSSGSSSAAQRRGRPIRPRNQVLVDAGAPLLGPAASIAAKLSPSNPLRTRWSGPARRHVPGCRRGRSCRTQVEAKRPAPPSPCDKASFEASDLLGRGQAHRQ